MKPDWEIQLLLSAAGAADWVPKYAWGIKGEVFGVSRNWIYQYLVKVLNKEFQKYV